MEADALTTNDDTQTTLVKKKANRWWTLQQHTRNKETEANMKLR